VSAAGLARADHPLLGAMVGLAGGGCVFTGRLSRESHPWLADHQALGVVLLPGTAFLELVLHAGGRVGCQVVQELTLQSPLVLSEGEGVQVQVLVGEPGEDGERSVEVYSRAGRPSDPDEALDGDGAWTRHASGVLASWEGTEARSASSGEEQRSVRARAAQLAGSWPPPGAVAVAVEDAYERLAAIGLEYGPAFQGLQAAWRHGNDVYAEVALNDEQARQATSYGIHPALLDSALHALGTTLSENGGPGGSADGAAGGARLPFVWGGVRLGEVSASSLRVCVSPAGEDSLALTAVDESGALVVSVESLTVREIAPEQLVSAGGQRDSLFTLDWRPLGVSGEGAADATDVLMDLESLGGALTEGAELPSVVVLDVSGGEGYVGSGNLPAAARGVLEGVLNVLQRWLADERLVGSRLVVLTRDAVAAGKGDCVDGLPGAGVWGLVRSAQSEHPGRVWLLDVDGEESSWGVLQGALRRGDEPQLAIRGGEVLAARLARAPVEEAVESFDPGRSVLVTGGTGGLGGVVARHLVSAHGVRSVVLASRRGLVAPGAARLKSELEELGALVNVVACDVSNREQVVALLEEVPKELPLGAVVHVAGTLDDGVIGSLSAERFDRVLAPKLDAAWHLHELTVEMDLGAFVLFSSGAGVLGSPGQSNYAAANAFLDALAAYRRARGLTGTAIAWGLWEQESELTSGLSDVDLSRLRRQGVVPIGSGEGLALFDRALATDRAQLVPIRLDTAALHALAREGALPAVFSGLVRAPARRGGGRSLARRLASVPEEDREGVVLDLVRGEVAGVLGHPTARAVDARRAFKDLGFDSLTAVELRNRLNLLTGLRLPATLVFDHPSPTAVAHYLLEAVEAQGGLTPEALLDAEFARLRRTLSASAEDHAERIRVRLRGLLAELDDPAAGGDALSDDADDLQSATDSEMFAIIDEELATS
jgi:acyl transferase domain-containing protein